MRLMCNMIICDSLHSLSGRWLSAASCDVCLPRLSHVRIVLSWQFKRQVPAACKHRRRQRGGIKRSRNRFRGLQQWSLLLRRLLLGGLPQEASSLSEGSERKRRLSRLDETFVGKPGARCCMRGEEQLFSMLPRLQKQKQCQDRGSERLAKVVQCPC